MMSDEGELFELLTDALREGPGGPSWARAVQSAREMNGSPPGDEYRLLLTTRQQLEDVRSLSQIQPSAEMNRRVLAALASDSIAPRGAPAAKTVAILALAAAVVICAVAGLVIRAMLGSGGQIVRLPIAPAPTPTVTLIGYESFESSLPSDWQPIGALRVRAARGLRLAGGPKVLDQFGGLVRSQALPPGEPVRLEATLDYRVGSNAWPEVFVTDDADFAADPPTDQRHELAWVLADDRPMVRTPNQSMLMAGGPTGSATAGGALERMPGVQLLNVRMKIIGQHAMVETSSGSNKLGCWLGANQLAADKPWHVGIRFVVHGQEHDNCVDVEAIRVSCH